MDEKNIDRHSINCFECGKLCDERECTPQEDGEGSLCPVCQELKEKRMRKRYYNADCPFYNCCIEGEDIGGEGTCLGCVHNFEEED